MTDAEKIQDALRSWAVGAMSTSELFKKVGLEWDPIRQDSLYGRLYKEIEQAKFRCASVAEQIGNNKRLESEKECCVKTAQAIASLIKHLDVREGL